MQLRTRRRRSGKTVYFMDYRLNGRRYQKVLNAVGSRKEALQVANLLWAKLVNEERLGGYAPEAAAEKCVTLGDSLAADLARPGVSPWTARMERSLGKHLSRILGERTPVSAISTADIERYKRQRLGERVRRIRSKGTVEATEASAIPFVKPITINKELEFLRALLNRLLHVRTIGRFPCEILKLPVEKGRARALTEDQFLQLLSACAAHSADMLEKAVFFGNTGFRKSETFGARWHDLDHTPGFIRVLTKKKGTSNEYYEDLLPLNRAAQDALASRRARLDVAKGSEALIFGVAPEQRRKCATAKNPEKPGTIDGIVCYWDHSFGDKLKSCAREAGIAWSDKLRIHHLRHTFATIALD